MKKTPLKPLSVGPNDAALLMGVSRSRVYDLKDAGELPFYHDGRLLRFPVAGIEARIARLMSAAPSTGPLLSSEERKLARQRATKPPPPEEQQLAVERATEPADEQRRSAKPTSDLAAHYFEGVRLRRPDVDQNEAEARSFESTVRLHRDRTDCSLEDAAAAVRAAIARAKEKV